MFLPDLWSPRQGAWKCLWGLPQSVPPGVFTSHTSLRTIFMFEEHPQGDPYSSHIWLNWGVTIWINQILSPRNLVLVLSADHVNQGWYQGQAPLKPWIHFLLLGFHKTHLSFYSPQWTKQVSQFLLLQPRDYWLKNIQREAMVIYVTKWWHEWGGSNDHYCGIGAVTFITG